MNVLPWEHIAHVLSTIHGDLSTPWTYRMMSRQCKIANVRAEIFRLAARNELRSTKYQHILSRFVHEIESGALRVYYANPEARRHIWGEGRIKDYAQNVPVENKKRDWNSQHPEHRGRIVKNKVIVEYGEAKTETKVLKVSIGSDGPWLKPGIRKHQTYKMPGEK